MPDVARMKNEEFIIRSIDLRTLRYLEDEIREARRSLEGRGCSDDIDPFCVQVLSYDIDGAEEFDLHISGTRHYTTEEIDAFRQQKKKDAEQERLDDLKLLAELKAKYEL